LLKTRSSRIARHCIEPTDGLFITLPEDDLAFQHTFITACTAAGIQAAMDPALARRRLTRRCWAR
jgi:glycerol-3-phosphate dehydrogenase